MQQGEVQVAEHNIILGLNIPNYSGHATDKIQSGRNIGEVVISFTTYHTWGPDRGTVTYPICKYGRYHGIIYFVGKGPDWGEIRRWLTYLEKERTQRQQYPKAYFVYGNDNPTARQRLERLGRQLNLRQVALTLVPSFDDKSSEIYLNKVNQAVENTFIIYRHSTLANSLGQKIRKRTSN